ncbi:hypothetical protein BZG36_00822 [Bifiguratus adelaidae]|uniref:Uncharacterized protein n=1 Tax=Bifiguratus adelaidae TaxID=1938954 RepID=A0A261Y6M8_9FUNG|nr:hypothetical protein BZG36_00822 [Bifiguratus adelaidae]
MPHRKLRLGALSQSKTVVLLLLLAAVILILDSQQHSAKRRCEAPHTIDRPTYLNLNTANTPTANDSILILTLLSNDEQVLPSYFQLLHSLDYPRNRISLAFLVSDAHDNTMHTLSAHAKALLEETEPALHYESIMVLQKDYRNVIRLRNRNIFDAQPALRAQQARKRNFLLSSTLRPQHDWVVWFDVNMVKVPSTALQDLIGLNVDIVTPNVFVPKSTNVLWGFDRRNWQETDESRLLQMDLIESIPLFEGFWEQTNHRLLMVDMPTNLGSLKKIPLDGVGASFTLVRADVHRAGVNFPAYVYKHCLDSEGFALMAKDVGYQAWGLPGYIVYHRPDEQY